MNEQLYFIGTDSDSHRYLVEFNYSHEWFHWLSLGEDDPDAWEAPFYAHRIDGATVVFPNPIINGEPFIKSSRHE